MLFASGGIDDAANSPYDVPTNDAAVTADVAAAAAATNSAVATNDATYHDVTTVDAADRNDAAASDDGSAASRHADDDLCNGKLAGGLLQKQTQQE